MKINGSFVIDTNILVYSINKGSEYFEYSRGLIEENGENVFLTQKSVAEFVCVLSRNLNNTVSSRTNSISYILNFIFYIPTLIALKFFAISS
jgi:predicted nucleic acid-binding protein